MQTTWRSAILWFLWALLALNLAGARARRAPSLSPLRCDIRACEWGLRRARGRSSVFARMR